MVPNFYPAMKAEEDRLEAELSRLPTYRRLKALRSAMRALADAYAVAHTDEPPPRRETSASDSAPPPTFASEDQGGKASVTVRRPGSMASIVGDAAEAWFRSTGRRAKSMAIVQALAAQGIPIRGQKPSGVVASILSNDERFDNAFDRRGLGYGLKDWAAHDAAAEAGDGIQPPSGEQPETASASIVTPDDDGEHADAELGAEVTSEAGLDEMRAASRDSALAA